MMSGNGFSFIEVIHGTLFYAFLAIVCVVTLVRVVRLVLALFAPGQKGWSIERAVNERLEPDRLAALAFGGAISCDDASNLPEAIAPGDVHRLLRMANARFNYRWRVSHARIAARDCCN